MAESEPLVTSEPVSVCKREKVTVVIAMDGSEFSDYALQFYAECLHRPGNETVIAHTTEYRCITKPDMSIVIKEIKALEDKATELVDRINQRLKELGIEGKVERIHGEPGPAIVSISNNVHADYIVVGCRGKGQIRKTITGSVTDFITHHSHVPVVVARHKDHLEKLRLHIPFKHHKKRGDPTSPTSPSSASSATPTQSPDSTGSSSQLRFPGLSETPASV
ncbi:TRAP-T-associated universal stress protein TeaD-like [Mercenaria mercenaria]|uniref:TRAP-T-associated universal stress protein TeaD-like n=1 Tax=Mercenaria mercenaria TaxID=6596 RepID=UPI00234F2013|nr:TRAP-T-associated universal stress protein TeaD-like [Mercenaria mercenaria]